MGSFDATCAVSNLGITCGDPIFALLIASAQYADEGEGNWEIISPLLPGTYDDYGNIALDEEPPDFLMDWLKENLMPLDAGSNSVHEPRFDPATVTWDEVMDLSHHARLFLKPDTWYEDSCAEHHTPPLLKLLQDAGYNTEQRFSTPNGIHVFPVLPGGNLHIIELPFEDREQHAEKIRDLLSEHYSVMIAAAPSSYGEGIIVAPKPAKETQDKTLFLGSTKDPGRHVRVIFVRQDLMDFLVPEDDLLNPLVEEIQTAAENQQKVDGQSDPSKLAEALRASDMDEKKVEEMLAALASVQSYKFDRVLALGGEVRQTATSMVLATPADQTEWFIRWVRASKLWIMCRGHLRSGLRPSVIYVGSQGADEDWDEQLGFHLACAKVLRKAIAARDKQRAEWYEDGDGWWTPSALLARVEAVEE